MKDSKILSIPALLFMFSLGLRLALIRNGPYDVDCLNLAIQSEKTLETFKLYNLFGSGYPLTVLLGAIFISLTKLFSITDIVFAVNLMSVVTSSFCVIVLYFLVRKLFDSRTAFLASIIFSVCPIFLDISLFGMSHAPSLLFLLMALLCLIHYKENFSFKYLFLSGLCLGLTGAARLQDLIVVGLPISFLMLVNLYQTSHPVPIVKKLKTLLLFWLIALTITLLLHLPLFFNPEIHYKDQIIAYWKTNYMVRESFMEVLIINFIFLKENFTLIGLIVAGLGLISLAKNKLAIGLFCFLWILVPLYCYGRLYISAPRFDTIFLPALIIPQSYFLAQFMKKNKLFLKTALVVFFIIAFIPFLTLIEQFVLHHQYALIPRFAQWVNQSTEPNALIIAADEGLFIEYYSHRQILYRPTNSFHIEEKELVEFQNTLNGILNQNIPVYFTYTGFLDYDPNAQFTSFIEKNYILGRPKSLTPYATWHQSPFFNELFANGLIKITNKR